MMMQSGQTTGNMAEVMRAVRAKFMVTRLIHAALLLGSLMFGGTVLLLSYKQMATQTALNPVILVAGMVCVLSIAGSLGVKTVLLKGGAVVPPDPNSMLIRYQTVCLVQWAMIEGAALFAAVVTLITRSSFAFVLFVACAIFLAYRRPSEREFLSMFAGKQCP